MAEKGKQEEKKEKGEVVEVNAEAPARRGLPTLFDDDLDSLFEDFFGRRALRPFGRLWPAAAFEGEIPKVDVVDRESELVVKAELPGVDKKDLEVSLQDRIVTIKASKRSEEETEEGEYRRREIRSGEFVRSLTLPAEVEADKAQAEFVDGLLTLTLPKTEETKKHRITVK